MSEIFGCVYIILLLCLLGLFFLAISIGIVALINLLCGYSMCRSETKVKFSFKNFKRLYDVIPEEFDLRDDYVWFHHDSIGFKFFGYVRYCLFHFFEQKRMDKVKTNKVHERILKNAQHDIDKKQEKIRQETVSELQRIKEEIASK